LIEPCSSPMKFKENISLINILTKFLKKYSRGSYFGDDFSFKPAEVFNQIEKWEYLIKCHLDDSSNRTIQYDILFSLITWPKDSENLVFPCGADEQFVSNLLLFFSFIHKIIGRKDFEIFEYTHRDLIFPLALILDNIDDFGASTILPDGFEFYFYWKFKNFFWRKNLDLLL
jgi:hypothetical protein